MTTRLDFKMLLNDALQGDACVFNPLTRKQQDGIKKRSFSKKVEASQKHGGIALPAHTDEKTVPATKHNDIKNVTHLFEPWWARRDSNPRPWLRRPTLYPAELPAHSLKDGSLFTTD